MIRWIFLTVIQIACRRCSNYIFILDLTPGFNILHKDNYKVLGFGAYYIRDLTVLFVFSSRCQRAPSTSANRRRRPRRCHRLCITCLAKGPGRTRNKVTVILQTTFSYYFSGIKVVVVWLKFHRNVFPGAKLNDTPALVQIMVSGGDQSVVSPF